MSATKTKTASITVSVFEPALYFAVSLLLMIASAPAAFSQMLEGSISKTEALMRLSRPGSGAASASDGMPPTAPPIRLNRLAGVNDSSLVDTTAFAPASPLSGNVRANELRLGVVRPDDFKSPSHFDIGAEENTRELKLAWEKWHEQFSRTIYQKWSRVADQPGKATLKVTVTSDRVVKVAILNSSGKSIFDRKLVAIIEGMSGDPGLTFPSKSQRRMVSFEADYVAAANVRPGYSWVKGDYETIVEKF